MPWSGSAEQDAEPCPPRRLRPGRTGQTPWSAHWIDDGLMMSAKLELAGTGGGLRRRGEVSYDRCQHGTLVTVLYSNWGMV